ncbi:dienelactone hydrolase family protein [Phenylobacterium aquaticum]|uniref:dienelactone hydrolase family protein n=2 Tax=Phenylobacterium aquaticum TaxID=1763816 RepID=UPI0026EDB088|nr:dienelactone hydrolase family protein [Phenylobacterium aquaticum]
MLDDQTDALSRRDFTALTVGAAGAVVVATGAQAAEVVESDVTIKTADGSCDAALFHPAGKGAWPAVLIWPDALGLRPEFRAMGKRLAAEGYVVLVPNPFYRSRPAPVFTGPFDFANADDRAKLALIRAPLTPDAVTRDAVAFVAFLDAQKVTNRKAKAGVQGYCMGGPMTMQTAAALPARIGAGGSFHGGGLVTAAPDSPHLLVPKIKARFYFGVAMNDDQRQPDAKDQLKAAFAAANVPAKIEVYDGALHGWCVPGSAVYNPASAERAWGELLALYKAGLV